MEYLVPSNLKTDNIAQGTFNKTLPFIIENHLVNYKLTLVRKTPKLNNNFSFSFLAHRHFSMALLSPNNSIKVSPCLSGSLGNEDLYLEDDSLLPALR